LRVLVAVASANRRAPLVGVVFGPWLTGTDPARSKTRGKATMTSKGIASKAIAISALIKLSTRPPSSL